jgi:hypothetical protein
MDAVPSPESFAKMYGIITKQTTIRTNIYFSPIIMLGFAVGTKLMREIKVVQASLNLLM